LVVGVEADIQAFGVQGSETGYSQLAVPNLPGYSIATVTQASRVLDYLGTLRGRVGVAIRPDALLYLTGGLAYGRASHTVTHTQYAQWAGSPGFPADADALGFASSEYADSRVGWAAGGGVEWAFRGNWSAKVEYLFYDLGRVRSIGLLGFDTNAIPGPDSGGRGLVATETASRFNGHLVRAGVNYRFDFFKPPVQASY
jgi:outer membrane immunogenic protein